MYLANSVAASDTINHLFNAWNESGTGGLGIPELDFFGGLNGWNVPPDAPS